MSTSIRKVMASVLIVLLMIALAFIGVDYLQIRRRVPQPVAADEQADLIRIDKAQRTLTLLRGSKVIRTYRVSLGHDPVGRKTQEGDGQTPEGQCTIDSRNSRSHFHLALHLSYPAAGDRADAQRRGVAPGGDVMIHGLPNGLGWLDGLHLQRDWTDGCIAVTNGEMDDIWAHVATGTEVKIFP